MWIIKGRWWHSKNDSAGSNFKKKKKTIILYFNDRQYQSRKQEKGVTGYGTHDLNGKTEPQGPKRVNYYAHKDREKLVKVA